MRSLSNRAKPRDLVFFVIGCAIAYHEVYVAEAAEPLLIFTVLFLWGLIPAFWGDRADKGPPRDAPDERESATSSEQPDNITFAWAPPIPSPA